MTPALAMTQTNHRQVTSIQLDSLADGPGILPFKLDQTKIISQYHTFLQDINIDEIQQKLDAVKSELNTAINKVSNRDFMLFKQQALHLFKKMEYISSQLETFEPKRVKRGIFNPLGTLIKSISGNLDNEDALRFENAIKILNENDQKLSNDFNKHISLYKNLTIQQTLALDSLSKNQIKLEKIINYMVNVSSSDKDYVTKYVQYFQIFTVISEDIQSLGYEITRLENIVAFSRTNSMHHSILGISDVENILSKLKSYYGAEHVLDIDIRYYYELIRLGTYYVDQRLVIVLKFPIMSASTYDLYRLCPVPNNQSQIILPPFPFMATNSQEYVYIEGECPKISKWHICEHKVSHQTRSSSPGDCIYNLIHHREPDETCQPITISLHKEALLGLDSQHYIISFPRPTKIQMSCDREESKLLQGSYFVTIPQNCNIKTPEFKIVNVNDIVRGHAIEIMIPPKVSQPDVRKTTSSYNLTSIDLNKLHSIQNQVMREDPTLLHSSDSSASLYHTTIPTYGIMLFGAAALIIAYYIKKKQQCHRFAINPATSHEVPEVVSMSPAGSKMSLEERKAAAAIFALKPSK